LRIDDMNVMHRRVFLTLALAAACVSGGCGDSRPETGEQAKVDPAETKKREQMIQDAYKSSPPNKGPGGVTPGSKTSRK